MPSLMNSGSKEVVTHPEGDISCVTIYCPAFSTSGGRKMYWYVGSDGTTYYADAEHDGADRYEELMTATETMIPEHIARSEP